MAKQLRRAPTLAERALWEALRDRRLDGLKFRRQQPLGPYIVDFYCIEHRLIIEVDGEIHDRQQEYDEARTEYLEQHGTTVLRFTNDDVLNRISKVLGQIRAVVSTLRLPLPRTGEGRGEGSPAAT